MEDCLTTSVGTINVRAIFNQRLHEIKIEDIVVVVGVRQRREVMNESVVTNFLCFLNIIFFL